MLDKSSLIEDVKTKVDNFYKENKENILLLSQLGSIIEKRSREFLKNDGKKLGSFINENLSENIRLIKVDHLVEAVVPNNDSWNEKNIKDIFMRKKNNSNEKIGTGKNYLHRENIINLMSVLTKDELARINIPADLFYTIIERLKKVR